MSSDLPEASPPGVPAEVFVALGSNLGDPPDLIRRAMDRLDRVAVSAVRRSSLWWSTPVNCPPGSPVFLNAVVALRPRTGETPESLLARLQEIEREFGRHPKQVLNEARPLDLDLIAWGQETRSTPSLILPHPRAHQRRFVLEPLAELAPNVVLPGQTRNVRDLLETAPPDPGLRRWHTPEGIAGK
ncbi:MAG: 2-amino-4-hydroxy-6-hydroxymethyldihydropteridine diphosphokinase [Verrucomicrobiae bacterium]|nr:2-amino-4-hydroxy-6-hydroxymethyldihydropteridine diphosphokinase [Verrucomicrobiae bacterium]